MFKSLRNGWLWLLAMAVCSLPSVAFAGGSINVSRFLGPLILIIVICILAGIALWAIGYWAREMAKIWALLPKILKFIVCIIAIIWIVLILAALAGVHIT
jgi:hypothetical protein